MYLKSICTACRSSVSQEDIFCPKCGKKLKSIPPSTSFVTLLSIFIGSVVLAPMGIIWGFRYIRQPDTKSRFAGMTAIGLSLLTLLFIAAAAISLVNKANDQVIRQMENLQGL